MVSPWNLKSGCWMAQSRREPKFCFTQGLNLVSCVVSQGKLAAWLVCAMSMFQTVLRRAFSQGEEALLKAEAMCEAASAGAAVAVTGADNRRSNSAANVGNCARAFTGSYKDTKPRASMLKLPGKRRNKSRMVTYLADNCASLKRSCNVV